MKFSILNKKPKVTKALEEVTGAISEEALFSAFDIYDYIYSLPQTESTGVEKENLLNMKMVWEGLKLLEKNNGKFPASEKEKYSGVFLQGPVYYDDLVRILIDHHNDETAAIHIFEKHPALHSVIPKQYDNPLQVIEVLIEYIRSYQWNLENFMNQYGEEVLG